MVRVCPGGALGTGLNVVGAWRARAAWRRRGGRGVSVTPRVARAASARRRGFARHRCATGGPLTVAPPPAARAASWFARLTGKYPPAPPGPLGAIKPPPGASHCSMAAVGPGCGGRGRLFRRRPMAGGPVALRVIRVLAVCGAMCGRGWRWRPVSRKSPQRRRCGSGGEGGGELTASGGGVMAWEGGGGRTGARYALPHRSHGDSYNTHGHATPPLPPLLAWVPVHQQGAGVSSQAALNR
jgi:hypothetical protein